MWFHLMVISSESVCLRIGFMGFESKGIGW